MGRPARLVHGERLQVELEAAVEERLASAGDQGSRGEMELVDLAGGEGLTDT